MYQNIAKFFNQPIICERRIAEKALIYKQKQKKLRFKKRFFCTDLQQNNLDYFLISWI